MATESVVNIAKPTDTGSSRVEVEERATSLFTKALLTFRESLSEEQRNEFNEFESVDEMFVHLEDAYSKHANGSKLLRCSRKLHSFSQSFVPYFEIVGIFVSVKPEWLATFWGSLRLVLKLGANYASLLEKIADMIEGLSIALPQYQRHVNTILARSERGRSCNGYRIIQLLSHVYADVLQLCLEIYQVFSRRKPGMTKLARISAVTGLIWKPLRERFIELELRMERHEQILGRELDLATQEDLTAHFALFQSYIKSLEGSKEEMSQQELKEEQEEKRRISKQVNSIFSWMGRCDFRGIYERSRQIRRKGTGLWFLRRPDYLNIRNGAFKKLPNSDSETTQIRPVGPDTSWKDRILILQGKPGYGKTVLSSTIIDDLETMIALDPKLKDHGASVCFFHISNMDESTRDQAAAFRALATQLIQKHRTARPAIDALSLFFEEAARNQAKASEDDLVDILQILLAQFPTFIVIDGIEEAHDPARFMSELQAIINPLDSKAILLIRPTVKLPVLWRGERPFASCAVALSAEDNLDDFHLFFNDQLRNMVTEGLFGNRPEFDILENVQVLAQKANGMFLWADLFVRYLRCEALSPHDRVRELSEVNRFDHLDDLYEGILTLLSRGYTKNKLLVSSVFRWICCPMYQLSTNTLHVALAIIPGQPTESNQYLCDFPMCIPRITGALVEIFQGVAVLIHSSFREYLESDRSLKFPLFSARDKAPIHAYLATQCFSYLAHDVPKTPLHKARLRQVALDDAVEKRQVTPSAGPSVVAVNESDIAQPARTSIGHMPQESSSHLKFKSSSLPLRKQRPLPSYASVVSSSKTSTISSHPPESVNIDTLGSFNAKGTLSNLMIPPPQTTNRRKAPRYIPTSVNSPTEGYDHVSRTQNLGPDRFFPHENTNHNEWFRMSEPTDQKREAKHSTSVASEAPATSRSEAVIQANDETEDNALQDLPFLSYAALSAFQHLKKSFDERQITDRRLGMKYVNEPGAQESQRIRAHMIHRDAEWLTPLSQFLVQDQVRTVWVETCYSYKYAPVISDLVATLNMLRDYAPISAIEGREIWWICHGLNMLDHGLRQLRERHGRSLLTNPVSIWGTSIAEVIDPNYWSNWTESQQKQPTLSCMTRFDQTREPYEGDRAIGREDKRPRSPPLNIQPDYQY